MDRVDRRGGGGGVLHANGNNVLRGTLTWPGASGTVHPLLLGHAHALEIEQESCCLKQTMNKITTRRIGKVKLCLPSVWNCSAVECHLDLLKPVPLPKVSVVAEIS